MTTPAEPAPAGPVPAAESAPVSPEEEQALAAELNGQVTEQEINTIHEAYNQLKRQTFNESQILTLFGPAGLEGYRAPLRSHVVHGWISSLPEERRNSLPEGTQANLIRILEVRDRNNDATAQTEPSEPVFAAETDATTEIEPGTRTSYRS